ncbi:MAG: glucokinase [Candidatus Binataceae bacterium]
MPRLVLAGDIGGTKTLLGIFREEDRDLILVRELRYPTAQFPSLESICAEFLRSGPEVDIAAACFGVPGPVIGGTATPSNIRWQISDKAMSSALGGVQVALINDLGASAYGVIHLPDTDSVVINPGASLMHGNIALIAAGTGLGEAALLAGKGERYHLIGSEGGHASFAPVGDEQIELLRFLEHQFGHVSWERVLSGPGQVNIYRFLRSRSAEPEPEWLTAALAGEDPARAITEAGLSSRDSVCAHAVEMFCAMYGAEAGNLALKMLALGGVFLCGGIAPKILPALKTGAFMRGFTGKGRLATMLKQIEVRVVTNPDVALMGAAHSALAML